MDLKTKYVITFLEAAGLPVDDDIIKKCRMSWFSNFRAGNKGLKLTDDGLKFVQYYANIEAYKVKIFLTGHVTAKLLLQLDEFIKSPYGIEWINGSWNIVVFESGIAVELMLYAGDLIKLCNNKEATKKFQQHYDE